MTIELKIYQPKAIRFMVYDMNGRVRGFETRQQAEYFVGEDDSYWIEHIPKQYKTVMLEEAPF